MEEKKVAQTTPKNFQIRCPRCQWGRMTTGLKGDLEDLVEVKSCSKCGKPRRFICHRCKGHATMLRVQGNVPPKPNLPPPPEVPKENK